MELDRDGGYTILSMHQMSLKWMLMLLTFTLKWLIVCNVDFTSIENGKKSKWATRATSIQDHQGLLSFKTAGKRHPPGEFL